MYVGVPIAVPVLVSDGVRALYARAIPKSAILTVPPRLISTFSGLRSRCAMPAVSAWVRPASTPSRTPKICGRLSSATSGRSDPPLTYSIAMYGTPPSS